MKKKTLQPKIINFCATVCLVTLIGVFSWVEAAPTLTKASGPRYGGTLRVAEQIDGVSIGYPAKMARSASMRQVTPAIEPLFRIDKAGNLAPWLATRYTSNLTAKTITLALRKNVKFHDGTDFNAQAVKWNLEQCLSAKVGGTEKFRSIDVINDYTIQITLAEWDNTVIGNLALIAGMMISPTAFKKNGEEWAMKNPVGTGPFEFVSWEKDVKTVYKKFPGYWQKGKPYLDRIEWTPVVDPLTRQLSLRKGELDIILWIAPKDAGALEKDGYVVTRARTGSGARSLIPDSANQQSPWANIRVRQAAQHAIDTETIVKTILYGEAEPANQFGYKGHWGYNSSVAGYPYNPTKAKQLLTAAGYPNGFKTKLLYVSNPQEDQFYTAVQGYLKAVGIDAELDPSQTGRYDQTAFRGGKWEGLIIDLVMPNPDVAAVLASHYSGGGQNFSMMLVPDDYSKAIKNALAAPDFKTKQKWVREAMKLMIDKYCLQVMLYKWFDYAVSQAYVHNHGFYNTPTGAWWTPEEAWLER